LIDFEVKMLDEKDLLFVSDLRNLGIQRNVALTIVYLSNVKEAPSREIEIGTGLRQPEISLALGFMQDRHWVGTHLIKANKKGRPLRVYSMIVKLKTIYEYYEQQVHSNYKESADKISRLKEIVKNEKHSKS
jgi:Predicted transcriptional regulator